MGCRPRAGRALPPAGTASWIKAVALGGVVLGALGLLVACGRYLDLFAAQPQLPTAPVLGGGWA